MAGLAFAAVLLLILAHVPIGVAMGVVGVVGYAIYSSPSAALSLLGSEVSVMLTNQDLAAVPLFLLMGSLASTAKLSEDAYDIAHAFLGHRKGGLSLATIGGCAGFGAVCGSSVATTAAMGRYAIPEMLKRKYSPSLAAGSVAAGGTLGFLIPPSIAMVVYGIATEQSVTKLFVACIVPAIIAIGLYFAATALYVTMFPNSGPASTRASKEKRIAALKRSPGIIVLFGVMMGGLYGGVFIPAEAAAVGVGIALVIAARRKTLSLQSLIVALKEAASNTAMIYLIVLGASLLSYLIVVTGLPRDLVAQILEVSVEPAMLILLLMVMYIVLGAIFDAFAAMLITIPVVLPLVTGVGYDPIWWGVMMVTVIELGMITPPIGLNVFVLKAVSDDITLPQIFKGVLPFVGAGIVRLVILAAFPALVLWLPNTIR